MKNHVFLAVHIGAGFQEKNYYAKYRNLISEAYRKGIVSLVNGNDGNKVLEDVLTFLEDSHLTNAGYGSNLTLNKSVECDASLMDGKYKIWGCVGALKNIKNPICIANKIWTNQLDAKTNKKTKLIQPCILVGKEAMKWASQYATITQRDSLISENALKDYVNNLETYLPEIRLQNKSFEPFNVENLTNPFPDNVRDLNLNLGTIGAVCIDAQGTYYAAVSSGGPLLKTPGRLGQAAMYGCGCWAQNSHETSRRKDTVTYDGIAISTTGCGEQLIKNLMAKQLSDDILSSNMAHEAFIQTFKQLLDDASGNEPSRSLAGAIAVVGCHEDPTNETSKYEFLWGHTCRTMCVAYGSINIATGFENRLKICFSSQPAQNCGKKVFCQGRIIKCPPFTSSTTL